MYVYQKSREASQSLQFIEQIHLTWTLNTFVPHQRLPSIASLEIDSSPQGETTDVNHVDTMCAL
uniref:Uncharacterized protein n=1 Tax=Arion vulgaris TaxID=1028688 RepID=A0A0B7A072_9EUPU